MGTVVSGDFEWDGDKADSNLAKHGVSFDEAATTFSDENALFLEDHKHDHRTWLIGFSAKARLLIVVHSETNIRTRIISARKAERHEAKLYSTR
jgi:uncharacterized protein